MRKSVQERRRHPLALEDLLPFAERQIARHQKTGALVTVGEDLEQQVGAGATERQVAQFIADQQIRFCRAGPGTARADTASELAPTC